MDKNKVDLLFHTLRYLKLKQFYYRFYYALRNGLFKTKIGNSATCSSQQLNLCTVITAPNSYNSGAFTFLNLDHKFEEIDWNYSAYGKLWTYNLNYFDFLNQEDISKEEGVRLIEDYINNQPCLKDGLEPYPTSLRIINWIKFLSKHKIEDDKIDATLFNHLTLLNITLEYHLLGNHLLENAFALLFGSYYFSDEKIYKKSKYLLKSELNEQILNDGAHFELSPMYHKILLMRLLDCITLIENNLWKKEGLLSFMRNKAEMMLGWLEQVTYKNGQVPQVNDTTFDIAPKTAEILTFAKNLKLNAQTSRLSDSGYRKWTLDEMEVFMDVGQIGPDYIPGHAHADSFNFEFYYKGTPIIVDPGISTYDNNPRRQLERSTEYHNTIRVDEKDSSEVWGGFRVARRAKIISLKESKNVIDATHDGYKNIGAFHSRSYHKSKYNFVIEDRVESSSGHQIESFLHFHPDCKLVISGSSIEINRELTISLENANSIALEDYDYSLGFNKTIKAPKIRASVESNSKIIIEILG